MDVDKTQRARLYLNATESVLERMEALARVKYRSSTDEEIAEARRRGREEQLAKYARSVRYSPTRDSFILKMFTGASVELPRRLVPYVDKASKQIAAEVELLPGGGGLHWERLDMDHSVPGLIREIFGLAQDFRRAGATKSKARAAASRANGRLGGRPRTKVA
jgi:hypothetical protein